ncbi:MAG: class I SAM-dependent methyltransferase [Actinobacteria bacterium]|nr:class I SAM-dependent methyltransferase [Actinomycetota bacterium]
MSAKRIIGGIYSVAADKLYEPLVVHGAFRLFGGPLNDLVAEQGRRAVSGALGEPILDMPVGTGYFTIEMARNHDGIVVGVDIAEGMVRETHSRARLEAPNLVAVQADAHHLPFEDASFKAVVCTNGLQVMPGLVPSIEEMERVLAPGGRLYISVILAPVGAPFRSPTREHLPTLMRPAKDIVATIQERGLHVTRDERVRLATLIEATKPS